MKASEKLAEHLGLNSVTISQNAKPNEVPKKKPAEGQKNSLSYRIASLIIEITNHMGPWKRAWKCLALRFCRRRLISLNWEEMVYIAFYYVPLLVLKFFETSMW